MFSIYGNWAYSQHQEPPASRLYLQSDTCPVRLYALYGSMALCPVADTGKGAGTTHRIGLEGEVDTLLGPQKITESTLHTDHTFVTPQFWD